MLSGRQNGAVASPTTRFPGKLNVGCGRNTLAGWINLDFAPLPGVDLVADLEKCATQPLPLPNDSIGEILLSHVLEHIRQPLPLMQELWRVALPDAKMIVRTPYGSSDDAFEDPTHVRQLFIQSFGYFSQPYYWRADYGYRGDWEPERITLLVKNEDHAGIDAQKLMERVMTQRNVVQEMVAELRCVKPLRPPQRELQKPPPIDLRLS
jgi:SAM-dependent methyltransferase